MRPEGWRTDPCRTSTQNSGGAYWHFVGTVTGAAPRLLGMLPRLRCIDICRTVEAATIADAWPTNALSSKHLVFGLYFFDTEMN